MAENKTQQNDGDILSFLNAIEDDSKRQDSLIIFDTMKQIISGEPKMWGDSIIGFGTFRYKYASGREGDWFYAGFSPRKQKITLYAGYSVEPYKDEISRLGKVKTGVGCIYFNKLKDINIDVLKELLAKVEENKCGGTYKFNTESK